ncbi:Fc.00g108430.m01.CDS01 [Cosmosporella sp. VM-42]
MSANSNGSTNSASGATASNGKTTELTATAMSGDMHPSQGRPQTSPYESVQNSFGKFKIIESTLLGGEKANSSFDTETKVKIAKALDSFGADMIEVASPAASEQSFKDCQTICNLGLKAKILTNVRCSMDDAKAAVTAGVNGVGLVIEKSSFLPEFSHGKSMTIQKTVLEVIEYLKSQGVEVQFSPQDSFRSDLADLLPLYEALDAAGVHRVGISDSLGTVTPRVAYDLAQTLRTAGAVQCDIETHFHDDNKCAVANAHASLEAGATHVNTSVLGIGNRTPLGGFMARMVVSSPEYTKSKYNIKELKALETLVADAVQIDIPFNNPVTGFSAFTHRAGIHAKAILNNPSTYEIINPEDFGLSRDVSITSRITGWNAVKSRAEQLGLNLTDDQVKEATAKIKELADIRPIATEDTDRILRSFHTEVQKA